MKNNNRPVAEILDLKRLQDGDNTEWTMFMGYFGYRLGHYVRAITGGSRFDDDIVANALADIYVLRHTYTEMDSMVKHLFASTKYEAYNVMYGYSSRFIMDEDSIIQISSPPDLDTLSLSEREEYEQWKDNVREAIREQAQRLPRKVKEFILTYLDGNREDVKAKRKELGVSSNQYSTILSRIRNMIETSKSPSSKIQDQLESIRLVFRYLPRQEKMVFAEALQCATVDEICSKLDETKTSVEEALGRCIRRLRAVWKDPILEHGTRRLDKIHSLNTPELSAVIQEELRKDMGVAKREAKLTRKQVDEIILMREQLKLSWSEIGRRMGIGSRVAKRFYLEDNIQADEVITELLLADVVAFRRLYRNGETTISAISAQYNIPRGRVVALIEGMDWKIVGKVVTLEGKKELMGGEFDDPATVREILKLKDRKYTYPQIALRLGCSERTAMRICNANGKRRNNIGAFVSDMLSKGMSVKQIAKQLGCTTNAVKYYLPKQ